MAEEATSQATEETPVAPAEQTAPDSASENQTEEQTSQSTEAEQASSDEQSEPADSSDKEQEQSKTEDSNEQSKDSKESKPLSRRSAAYRIQQLTREVKELRQQKKPQAEDDWDEEPRTDEQPNIAELVAKEVEKRLTPVITESSRAADDSEIGELFSGNAADRSKYEGQIRSLWNLSQYNDVAALDLLNMLRGKEMDQRLSQAKQDGVEEYKKAEKEAKESSASGTSNSNRTGKSGKSVADMSPEELQKHNEQVLSKL